MTFGLRYPDIDLPNAGYLILKFLMPITLHTSAVKGKSGFRYFYYTNVSKYKIKANARHLLLNVSVTQDTPRYWKIDGCAYIQLL